MKSLLLHIEEDEACEARLQAAVDITHAYGGHVTCLQTATVDAPPRRDLATQHFARDDRLRARTEKRLDDLAISWSWQSCGLAPAQAIADHSHLSDVIILSHPANGASSLGRPLPVAAEVCIHARTLVLAVPPGGRPCDGGPVAIAWNGSAEAAHALRLSLPILLRSSQLHLVTVGEECLGISSHLACAYLARYGLDADLHEWPRKSRTVAAALLAAAIELEASALVMGACGYARGRGHVLGEVTRELLDHSPVPLLLAH